MKFIVSSSYLKKQLAALNGVISPNPPLPILENFLFEIKGGTLTVTASDIQTRITIELEVEANEDGSIAIPAKILLDTLQNLPDQPVTFSIDNNTYSIEINSDNGRYKLAGESTADFPKAPTVADGYSVDFSSEILSRAISHTLFATSTDDLRPAMAGVYLNLTDTSTTFVATDSHRLIRYRRVDIASDQGHSMIMPRKTLTVLKATIPQEITNVKLEFNASNAFFSFNNMKMICRLVDERFPDYENVIPVGNDNNMTIDRQELLSSLRRISIYANKTTHQIRLKITGSELMISAEDLEFSNEANERLACDHTGEDIEIGFNAKFLIEMLNNSESKEITFQLSTSNKAGIIIASGQEEDEDLLMLIMPVMLNNKV